MDGILIAQELSPTVNGWNFAGYLQQGRFAWFVGLLVAFEASRLDHDPLAALGNHDGGQAPGVSRPFACCRTSRRLEDTPPLRRNAARCVAAGFKFGTEPKTVRYDDIACLLIPDHQTVLPLGYVQGD